MFGRINVEQLASSVMFPPGEVAEPPIQDNDVGAGFDTVIVNEQVVALPAASLAVKMTG